MKLGDLKFENILFTVLQFLILFKIPINKIGLKILDALRTSDYQK